MSETMLYESQVPLLYENTKTNSAGKPILGKLHAPFFDLNNPTRNGRDYSQVAEDALMSEEFKEKLSTRTFFGRLGHPMTDDEAIEDPAVRACVILTDVTKNKKTNMIEGTLEIINNAYGQQLKSLIDAGCVMGVSTRGTGEAKSLGNGISTVVPGTYEFEALDVVTLPAVKKARCTVIESKGKVVKTNELDEEKLLSLLETTDWKEKQVFESLKTTIESSELKHKDVLLEGIELRQEEKDNYIIGTIRDRIYEAEEFDYDAEYEKVYKEVEELIKNDTTDYDSEIEFDIDPETVETTETEKTEDMPEPKESSESEGETKDNKEATDTKELPELSEEELNKLAQDQGMTPEDMKKYIEENKDEILNTEVDEEALKAAKETGLADSAKEEEEKKEEPDMENNKDNMNESETIVSLVDTITELSEKLADAGKEVEKYKKLFESSKENKKKLLEADEEGDEDVLDLSLSGEEENNESTDEAESDEQTETGVETVDEETETSDAEESEIDVNATRELVSSLLKSINELKTQLRDVQEQSEELETENDEISEENLERVDECVLLRKTLRKNNEQLLAIREEYSKKLQDLTDKANSLQSELNESKKTCALMKNLMIESVAKANRISVEDLKAKVSLNESIDSINSTAKSIRESMDRKNLLGITSLGDFGRTVSQEEFKESYDTHDSLETDSSYRFVNLVKENL